MIFSRFKLGCVFFVLWGAAAETCLAADTDAVISPSKRQETLDKAKKLLVARNSPLVTTDPFHSESFAEMVSGLNRPPVTAVQATASPKTPHEILQAIAMSLKPTGNFVLSGQPTLVFGQKRVKAGGSVTITFEGTEYTLEVTAIERTSFTLRLNREEFTRPIK